MTKQKGYYNPEKKNYCKYHTSMDYLQTAINGFRIKNPYKKDWLAFVTILDKSLFRTSAVNQKQINRIYSVINQFISERKKIFASDMGKEEKFERSKQLYQNLVYDINSETIGFSTLYRLLCSVEEKDNSQIKNTLLQILFLCGNDSFNKAVLHSASELEQLESGGNDIKLFGTGYKIAKIRVNSEI